MSTPTSDPINIGVPSRDRRHSILSDFLPDSLPLPSSFIATSPIVREILSRDIADCSSDEGVDNHEDDAIASDSESQQPHAADAKLAFHPNGVAYGCGYSTIPIQGVDCPVANHHDLEESTDAELTLLRDNHIIPPRDPWKKWKTSSVGRLYRSVFGTKTRDHERPSLSQEPSAETTPLLRDALEDEDESESEYDYTPPTPGPNEIHEQWEEAVAAHHIKTTWQREAKTLVQYSAPLIATFLLHYSVTIGSVLTVGRLGMEELAAVNRMCFNDLYPNVYSK